MADPSTAPFVMHGAREAIAGGLAHIEQHVKGIELAVVENPGLAFDLAKTLVESTCRAVLSERSIAFSEKQRPSQTIQDGDQHLAFPAARSERGGRRPQESRTDTQRSAYRHSRRL